MEDLIQISFKLAPLQGWKLLLFSLLGLLPLAQPAAKIQVHDRRRRLLETPVQVDPTADLLGLVGRDVVGFQPPVGENGELVLGVQVPAVGTAAVGLAAGALALDERAREHLAESRERAQETTTQVQLRIAGHEASFTTDINDNVRIRLCQDPLEICKNDLGEKV
jgi:hypothetical protein